MDKPKTFRELQELGTSVTMSALRETLEDYAETGAGINKYVVTGLLETFRLRLHKADAEALLASARKGALKQWQLRQPAAQLEYDNLAHFLEDTLQGQAGIAERRAASFIKG